ncbi:hypothetical protein ACLOJK_001031 [Asimina triloba]
MRLTTLMPRVFAWVRQLRLHAIRVPLTPSVSVSIFASEVAWSHAYEALSKIFASLRMKESAEEERKAVKPTSSDEMLLKDHVLQLQAKKALQRGKVIRIRNPNKSMSSELTISDEMVLRDYAIFIRLKKKLDRQHRKLEPGSSRLNRGILLGNQRSTFEGLESCCSDVLEKRIARQPRKLVLGNKENRRILLRNPTSNDDLESNGGFAHSQTIAAWDGKKNAVSEDHGDMTLRARCENHSTLERLIRSKKDVNGMRIKPNRRQAIVCQTCGATGYSELLLFCFNCQISAVHRYASLSSRRSSLVNVTWYCLHEIPENNEVEVSWVYSKASGISAFASHPLRNGSEHGGRGLPSGISYSTEIINSGPGIEMNKGGKKTKRCLEILLNCDGKDAESLRTGCIHEGENPFNSIPIEKKDGPDHDIGRKCPSEYQVSGKVPFDANALNSLGSQPVALQDHYVHAKPIIDRIWRGCFDVNNSQYDMLVGHLSSKACFKVIEAARRLPPMLCAEKLPRAESWPKVFQGSHPTDENIGLYFFPDTRRGEQLHDELLHDINSHDLALRISAGEADLLVFSSLLLPEQSQKFAEKHYLWGVFKAKKASVLFHDRDDDDYGDAPDKEYLKEAIVINESNAVTSIIEQTPATALIRTSKTSTKFEETDVEIGMLKIGQTSHFYVWVQESLPLAIKYEKQKQKHNELVNALTNILFCNLCSCYAHGKSNLSLVHLEDKVDFKGGRNDRLTRIHQKCPQHFVVEMEGLKQFFRGGKNRVGMRSLK